MADQAIGRARALEKQQEAMPILVREVDVGPARTASAEMEDQAGTLDSRTRSHGM
jgi:hypothetical protein